jgi:hypothetical protein
MTQIIGVGAVIGAARGAEDNDVRIRGGESGTPRPKSASGTRGLIRQQKLPSKKIGSMGRSAAP